MPDACRKYGVSQFTLYAWKKKYQDLSVSEAQRLRALEEENRKLKVLVVNLRLDNAALKDVLSKKTGRACCEATGRELPPGTAWTLAAAGLRVGGINAIDLSV